MIALLKKEVTLTHQLDPTRAAGIGGAQSDGGTRIDMLGDVAGYNGDGHGGYDNPGMPNMVSEYGSNVTATRPGSYDPGWGELGG